LNVDKLIAIYPKLYHMAERDAWPSIRSRGLLSTVALLEKCGVLGQRRFELESEHRPEKVLIGEGSEQVVLRDQKPMAPVRLATALLNGVTTRQWYEAINSKVFFWVDELRLHGLLNARSYKKLEHDVLVLDTASFVAAHEAEIWLCHMNSGNTFPFAHARDLTAFKRIADYPVASRGDPVKKVVELLVDHHVLDIADHVIEVRRMQSKEFLRPLSLKE